VDLFHFFEFGPKFHNSCFVQLGENLGVLRGFEKNAVLKDMKIEA